MYNFAKSTAAKDPYNFDIGSKPSTSQPKKQEAAEKSKKPQNMEPKRLAIRYDPPTIIVEYLQPNSGKLYHHKMKLLKLQPDTPIQHALEYLKKKHAMYFMNNKLPEKQLLELIGKLQKRLQINQPKPGAAKPGAAKPQTAKPGTAPQSSVQPRPTTATSSASQRPTTASTVASQKPVSNTKSKLQKDIEDYGMSEEDLYNYAMKNHKSKQPVLEDSEEEEEDYEQNYDEEESDEEITEEQYKMLYQKMGYNQLNLNKMSVEELRKHKEIMESMYKKNSLKPGDKNYQYDLQKEFKPSMQNEWDMDDEEDYDIV